MAPPQRRATLAGICSLIDRDASRALTVPDLARMCGLSRAHFIRAFAAATGRTPHEYLRARRIERAKELLVTTPMPVTEICTAVGFQSLGSFSSLFRRLTGEAPAAWRARRRRPVIIPGCFLRMHRVPDPALPAGARQKKRRSTFEEDGPHTRR